VVKDDIENVRQAAWMNQTPAVILNIQRQPGANIISVVNQIHALLPQLTSTLPASVHVVTLSDMTTTIRASVKDVEFSLMLTIALVVMVIFLFLRSVAATIIPSIAVPLSLVGTFGVMYLLGYSLDNLSLMALTISTGFVVDDAIVMIENISRYIEQGENPLQAALKGAEQIGFTIISLTISLIAVLIPLLFMADIVGRLFREFAVTLSVTILMSAIVSLTLTPMMSARLLKHKPEAEQGRLFRASENVFNKVIGFYVRTLKFVLRFQTIVLLIALATLLLTVFLFYEIPKGFFPIQDTGVIQGVTEATQSVSFSEMSRLQQSDVQVILKDPAVQSLSSFIGIDGTNTTLNGGRVQINLKPLANRNLSASDVIRRLQTSLASIPGITLYMQPVQDLSVDDRVSRTQFQYTLEDPNADELNSWAPKMLASLQQLPELSDAASDQQTQGIQANLTFDRVTASRLGITASAIDETLYDAFGQREVSTMFTQLNQYHVVLEVKPGFDRTPLDLRNIYIRSAMATTATTPSATAPVSVSPLQSGQAQSTVAFPNGGQVPLGDFTTLRMTSVPIAINHQGQFPVITLSFNLAPNASLGDAIAAVNKAKDSLGMPASIQGAFQGTASAFENSLTGEPMLILAALVTVYLVLGVLYESYIHPITIISSLPSAGVGALLALYITGNDFSVIALIGIVLLIGIVKKNAIMMIDFALQAEREQNMSPYDAICQASQLRFRPIMMTTMAALLGGLPLALGSGTGSELRRPLGITIVGGLIVSQVLTLYTTPVVYLFFDRLARRFRYAPEVQRGPALAPEPAPAG